MLLLDGANATLDDLRLDTRQEIARRKRLHQIVVGRGRQALEASFLAGARRQHDDRHGVQVRIGAQLPQQAEAIELRHHHIGDDDVGAASARDIERDTAVARRVDVPALGEQPFRVVAHVGVIVGQQNSPDVDAGTCSPLACTGSRVFGRRGGLLRKPAQCFLHVRRGARCCRGRRALDHLVLRQMGGAERHRDREDTSLPQDTGRRQLAAMQLDELLHQRQANPGAFVAAALRALDTVEAIEDARQFLFGNAGTGIGNRHQHSAVDLAHRHGDAAGKRELESVGDEVEDDLFPHLAIDVHRNWQGRAVDDELEASLLHRGAERAGEIGGEGCEIDRLESGTHASGFDAREVEQCVDELEETLAVAMRDVELIADGAWHGVAGATRFVERTEQQRQRRTKLVADVAEEGRLGAIDLGERLGAATLLFVSVDVGQTGGDLPDEQFDKAARTVVERPERIETGDEHTGRTLLSALCDGQDERLCRRPLPRPRRQIPEAASQLDDLSAHCRRAAATWRRLRRDPACRQPRDDLRRYPSGRPGARAHRHRQRRR